MEWFSALDEFSQFFWIIALVGSLIFLFVIITTFAGIDGDSDLDTDADIDADTGIGFQFITFKNLVGFFTIFGWTGVACLNAGISKPLSVVIAFVAGLFMMGIYRMEVEQLMPITNCQIPQLLFQIH